MEALVIINQGLDQLNLTQGEKKTIRSQNPLMDSLCITSVNTLKQKEYIAYVKELFNKQKKQPKMIIIRTDVPHELALKIAYATGVQKDPWIYLMTKNGRLVQIYSSELH